MGEIRTVGPGKTCRYPYPVCAKRTFRTGKSHNILIRAQGYKSAFMLNSAEHEILNAHKHKIKKNQHFFRLS